MRTFTPLLALAWIAPPAPAATVINGVALSEEQQQQIEARHGVRLQDGRFWYDARAGLWGREGGPTAGFAPAGVALGGPLAPEASLGRSGVFINGRNLPALEVAWLMSLGPVWPGRYWLNALGYVGMEGQDLPFVHLPTLVAQKQARSQPEPGRGPWIASGGGCLAIAAKNSSGIGNWGASNC